MPSDISDCTGILPSLHICLMPSEHNIPTCSNDLQHTLHDDAHMQNSSSVTSYAIFQWNIAPSRSMLGRSPRLLLSEAAFVNVSIHLTSTKDLDACCHTSITQPHRCSSNFIVLCNRLWDRGLTTCELPTKQAWVAGIAFGGGGLGGWISPPNLSFWPLHLISWTRPPPTPKKLCVLFWMALCRYESFNSLTSFAYHLTKNLICTSQPRTWVMAWMVKVLANSPTF